MSRISITGGSTVGGKRRAATHYGARKHETAAPAGHCVEQGVEVFEFAFDYSDLPAASEDELFQRIPAGSTVLSAELKVTEEFTGGTSYNIGLAEPDGTAIDPDGLFAGVAPGAEGGYFEGAGALVGAAAGLSADGCVVAAASGTYTAGKAQLIVRFRRGGIDRSKLNDEIEG